MRAPQEMLVRDNALRAKAVEMDWEGDWDDFVGDDPEDSYTPVDWDDIWDDE
jgi:hypothetical protein